MSRSVATARHVVAVPRPAEAALPTSLQRRWYTPPSKRTWSKQHHRIRVPRPMVDRLDIGRELPQKEWWRERPLTPATFLGFPDVTKQNLRGGDIYVEQMDAVTLAVLADRCVKEKVVDPYIWEKFSWRAQQIATRTHEPDLCYVFRAFARMDWLDQNMMTTYLGRIHRRLANFHLPDVAVILEAFANPRFREPAYFRRILLHLALLLQHRDDAKVVELARCCAALGSLSSQGLAKDIAGEVLECLELLAEALLFRDLSDLSESRAVLVLNCYISWGLVGHERVNPSKTSADLCWTVLRSLKGRLRTLGREKPEDLGVLAMAMARGNFDHEELWQELLHNLEHEAYRLPGHACAAAVFGAAKSGQCSPQLYSAFERRIAEVSSSLTATDCARAAWGFLRGPRAIAERVVLQGPVGERVLSLGPASFGVADLTMTLDGLSRASLDAAGVEVLASLLFEALHEQRADMSGEQLASVVRSLTYLRPDSADKLRTFLDAAQKHAVAEPPAAVASEEGEDEEEPALVAPLAPRHYAMICQGIVGQPSAIVPDASRRLAALVPSIVAALEAKPAPGSAVQLLNCLAQSPNVPQRGAALDACAQVLQKGAHSLEARALVSLARALSVAKQQSGEHAWSPPEALFVQVETLLDMKRYDLPPGTLWRAQKALSSAGRPEFRLEERDQPESRGKKWY